MSVEVCIAEEPPPSAATYPSRFVESARAVRTDGFVMTPETKFGAR